MQPLLMDLLKSAVGAIFGVGLGYVIWLKRFRQDLRKTYDLGILEARMEEYPKLWRSFGILALYGNDEGPRYADVTKMGSRLRLWYFRKGGLLMSGRAQRVYLLMQHALQRVRGKGLEDRLARPADGVDAHRKELGLRGLEIATLRRPWLYEAWCRDVGRRIDAWTPAQDPTDDFVVLQFLGSSLRSALTADLYSRDPAVLDKLGE